MLGPHQQNRLAAVSVIQWPLMLALIIAFPSPVSSAPHSQELDEGVMLHHEVFPTKGYRKYTLIVGNHNDHFELPTLTELLRHNMVTCGSEQ